MPHPPPQPYFKVRWRGRGWQRRPSMLTGIRVGRPLPKNPKTTVVIMIKGPQSRGLRAPRSALVTYALTTAGYKPNTTRTKPRNTRTRKRTVTTKKGKKGRCGAWPRCRCPARSTGRGRRACTGRREHKGNPKLPEGGLDVPSA